MACDLYVFVKIKIKLSTPILMVKQYAYNNAVFFGVVSLKS